MTEPFAITMQHEMTVADDLALRRAIHRALPLRVPMVVFGGVCAGIGVFAGVGAGLESGVASAAVTALPWALLSAVWLTLGLVPLAMWSRHARVAGRHERTLDDAGLHVRAGGVSIDLPWHAMARTIETPEFFLFYDAQGRAHYLPKRGLREREQREIQRWIAARSPERVRRLGA